MNSLFRSWYFPLVLQLLTLAGFVLLIVDGWAANTDDMAFAAMLRNTNLANLMVWSYWWPLIILSAILSGACGAWSVRWNWSRHSPRGSA